MQSDHGAERETRETHSKERNAFFFFFFLPSLCPRLQS